MSLGKGDPVPPPPGKGEYEVKFASRAAAVGWQDLCRQAPGNTLDAWIQMRTCPAPVVPTSRRYLPAHSRGAWPPGDQRRRRPSRRRV